MWTLVCAMTQGVRQGAVLLTFGAAGTHLRVKDPITRLAPAAVAFVLAASVLTGHLWLATH